MTEKIAHDHYPEVVENGQGTRRLELLGIKEHLRKPSDRRDFFAMMSDEQFQRAIGYVNSVTRGRKIEYDYADGQLPSADTPSLEDKTPLMNLTFQAVREIVDNTELDDKTALRRAGMTLAGAMNYIHPKKDGNGRTGRLLHYLIEFGTERGDEAFNEETYALIAKLPLYDTDSNVAIRDTPPEQLEGALNVKVKQSDSEHFASMTSQELASARVVAFLDMMKGKSQLPIREEVFRPQGSMSEGTQWIERIAPGEIDGLSLYEKDYLSLSSVPNRLPQDVPPGANRVMAEKGSKAPGMIILPADFV